MVGYSVRDSGLVLVLVMMMVPVPTVRGQTLPVGDPLDDYARLMQLSGDVAAFSFAVRPLPVGRIFGDVAPERPHPWQHILQQYTRPLAAGRLRAGIFDPWISTYWNSARPAGQNEGAVWQGRGGTFAFTTGAFVQLSVLSASLRPSFIYAQNRDFDLWPGTSFNEYPGRRNLDMPQRFGNEPISRLDLGHSYVRLDFRGLAVGVSNENMWWGPASRNSIVMSNNAPGFPHGFVGTTGPVDVWIGKLQTRWLWGRLTESGFFNDPRSQSDKRFITGAVLDLEPRFLSGLQVGVTRVFVRVFDPDRDPLSRRDYLIVAQNPLKVFLGDDHDRWGFDKYDQMLSVYGRWLLPESGFEVYGEYARGDHSWDFRDMIVQLQHAGGYTFGLQKAFELRSSQRRLRVRAELTRLESPKSDAIARTPGNSFFYLNTIVRQGYTQRGQLMGAGIGPGSNSQCVEADLFAPWGKAGGFFRRVVYDNDRYHQRPEANNSRHEVEFISGVSGHLFYRGFEIGGEFALSHLLNRFYIFKNDELNVNLKFTLRRTFLGYR